MSNKCPVCKSKRCGYIDAPDDYNANIIEARAKEHLPGKSTALCFCLNCGTVYVSERVRKQLQKEPFGNKTDEMFEEKPCISKHTCGYDYCNLDACPEYVPKTKDRKWAEEEEDG